MVDWERLISDGKVSVLVGVQQKVYQDEKLL